MYVVYWLLNKKVEEISQWKRGCILFHHGAELDLRALISNKSPSLWEAEDYTSSLPRARTSTAIEQRSLTVTSCDREATSSSCLWPEASSSEPAREGCLHLFMINGECKCSLLFPDQLFLHQTTKMTTPILFQIKHIDRTETSADSSTDIRYTFRI